MQPNELMAVIEAILFVSGEPVLLADLQKALEVSPLELNAAVNALESDYDFNRRGIRLKRFGEHIQLATRAEYAPYVERLLQPAQQKTFSQSLIETLAVVAYRQPATRADVEAVRGVRCEYAMSQLVKLNMVQPVGRKEVVGRPVLYGTTDAFLRQFGINTIADLPNYEAYSKGEAPIETALTV